MKFIILSISVLFSLSSFAATPVGKYTQKHQVMAMYNNTAKKCKADGGKWIKKEQICVVNVSDDAEVIADGEGFSLHITTIATNFHSCEFEGPATLVGNALVSKVATEEYNSETGEIEPATCELTATLSQAGKKMSIATNNKCRSFCGANGWLDVELTKVKK
jgi:hypothetical protein